MRSHLRWLALLAVLGVSSCQHVAAQHLAAQHLAAQHLAASSAPPTSGCASVPR